MLRFYESGMLKSASLKCRLVAANAVHTRLLGMRTLTSDVMQGWAAARKRSPGSVGADQGVP